MRKITEEKVFWDIGLFLKMSLGQDEKKIKTLIHTGVGVVFRGRPMLKYK